MTVQGTEHGVDAGLSEPIACSLTNADLKAQRDRWINLSTESGLIERRRRTVLGSRSWIVPPSSASFGRSSRSRTAAAAGPHGR
jgi:hypothetical protein